MASAAASIAVTSITPNVLAGNITTTVVVRGSGFQPGASLAFIGTTVEGVVSVDSLHVVSTTQITATITTPRVGGPIPFNPHVVVTNPDGGQGVLPFGLTIDVQPILTGGPIRQLPQGSTTDVDVFCIRCNSPAVGGTVSGTGVTVIRASGYYHLTIQVSPTAAPGLRTVTVLLADRGTVSATIEIVPFSQSADLAIGATTGGPFVAGGQGTFLVGIRNAGPVSIDGVFIEVDLPAGITFASATGTTCTYAFQSTTVLFCSFGTLVGQQAAGVRIVVDVAATSARRSATVFTVRGNDRMRAERSYANNSATVDVVVARPR